MIFFEIVGKLQWYLIGAGVMFAAWYSFQTWRAHANPVDGQGKAAAKTDSSEFNKVMVQIWGTLVVLAALILIMGEVVPAWAQRGANEIGGVLGMTITEGL